MSSRSSSRLVGALALLVLGLVGWLVIGLSKREPNAHLVESPTVVAAPEKAQAGTTSALAESPLDPAQSSRAEAEPASSATDGPSADELADARWVSGRVRFPEGTPADERAWVVAVGRVFGSKTLHRASVGADGRFRVAFAPKTRKPTLRIDARYVFLDEPKAIDQDGEALDVELVPLLGGGLRGRVQLDPGSQALARELVGATVSVQGWAPGMERPRLKTTVLGADLAYEVGGLDPRPAYSISCSAKGFATVQHDSLRVTAGEFASHDFQVSRGATVGGSVRDEAGAPIQHVTVHTNARERGVGPVREWDEKSDAEGRYTCTELRAGEAVFVFVADGFVERRLEPITLAAGEQRSGLDVVLSRGLSISGVARYADDTPAERVSVTAAPNVEPPQVPGVWISRPEPRAKTDAEGRFTITGLVAGAYAVTARSNPKEAENLAPGAKRAPRVRFEDRRENVTAGTTDLVLTLDEGTTLSGRVVDDLGAPVRKFTLTLTPSTSEPWNPKGRRTVSSKHDDGAFQVHGLAEGPWSVVAKTGDDGESETISVTVPADSEPLQLVVPRPAAVRGFVVDPSGVPVAGAYLRVDRSDAQFTFWSNEDRAARSDEHGAFELTTRPGTLHLSAVHASCAPSEPQKVELTPAGSAGPLTLRLREGGTIVGRVHDRDGRPDLGRAVSVWGGSTSLEATTDAQGRFRIEHVPPGRAQVQLQPSEAELGATRGANGEVDYDLAQGPNSQASVEVVDGAVVEVELGGRLVNGIRVSGVLRGLGVESAKLQFYGPMAEHALGGSGAGTRADAAGRYELELRDPGQYMVSLELAGGSRTSLTVTIPPGPSFVLDITLSAGSIRGRVLDAAGAPAAGAHVSASSQRADPEKREGQVFHANAETDAEGAFVLSGLSAATYTLTAMLPGRFDGARWRSADAPASVEGVELADGARVEGIVLRFPATGRVHGHVRDAAGRPVAGAHVLVRGSEKQPYVSTSESAADGSFEFELAAGTFGFLAQKGSSAGQSDECTVREGAKSEVVIVLSPGNTLIVACRDAGGQTVQASVSVLDPRGRDCGTFQFRFDAEEGEQRNTPGTFRNLPDGEYVVSLRGQSKSPPTERVVLKGGVERRVSLQVPE